MSDCLKVIKDVNNIRIFPRILRLGFLIMNPTVRIHERNIRYSKLSASHGKLEKVFVRNCFRREGNIIIYKDALGGLWNEEDLITYEEAQYLIERSKTCVRT